MSKRKRESDTTQVNSILQAGDGAFPRGGGSVLTPLEIRQATNEASQDLFDSEKSSKKVKSAKPVKAKNGKKAKKTTNEPKEDKIHIESVNSHFVKSYKGTTVLAQIIRIDNAHLRVALPNNLIGEIPITHISPFISDSLPKLGEDDEDDEEEPQEVIELPHYKFSLGQWLRVTAAETNTSNSKSLLLTCDPSAVNEAIDNEDLVPGMLVQGYVKSVEDRGAIIELGKEKSGFISKKELVSLGISLEDLVAGQVRLFEIVSSSGRTLTLSDASAHGKRKTIASLSSVDSLVAGTLVEALVTEVEDEGLMVKIFGLRDGTIDSLHAGLVYGQEKPNLGDKILSRIIYSQGQRGFNTDETVQPVLMLSKLDNVVNLTVNSQEAFKPGQLIDGTKVTKTISNLGVYVEVAGQNGFVHISRIADDRVDSADSASPVGSIHQARVLDYSPVDNLYIMAFAPSLVNQRFVRLQDIPIGETFRGIISGNTRDKGFFVTLYNYNDDDSVSDSQRKQKLKNLVKSANKDAIKFRGIAGPLHISDVRLKNPDLKYPMDSAVKCRVIAVTNGGLRLTLKKSLVNSDDVVFQSWADVKVGAKIPGTIVKILNNGAVVEFFGGITGFLPLSEMSEASISHPSKLFNTGQTVRVTVLKAADGPPRRMIVSCRSSSIDPSTDNEAFDSLIAGTSVVEGTVTEKTANGATLDLGGSVRGILPKGHTSDDIAEVRSKFKSLKVGDKLKVIVLQKLAKRKLINVSAKESLIEGACNGGLLSSFDDVVKAGTGKKKHGFITNISDLGLFVGFANGLSGLILKSEISEDGQKTVKSFAPFQSVEATISRIDKENSRFYLTLRENKKVDNGKSLVVPGEVAKVIVASVKATQLNVKVGESGKQGRIDVSEVYDKYEDIKNVSNPLSQFKKGQELDAKIIGFHDVRNHKFLPISHRSSGHAVFELTIKPSVVKKRDSKVPTPLSLDDIKVGDKHIAFINNITADFVWVNITPGVRGRISLLDLSDDTSKISSEEAVEKAFPLGSALETVVRATEPSLRLAVEGVDNSKSWDNIEVGDIVPALVLKSLPQTVLVRIGGDLTAAAYLTDLSDKYTEHLPETFAAHDLVLSKITEIDTSNKKVYVTLRKSETTNQNVSVQDPVITEPKVGDVVRGFVRNVADGGVFVALSRTLQARVQIKNLSDDFLKEWKKYFTVNQLVAGRVVEVDAGGRVELSLKKSVVEGLTDSEAKAASSGIADVELGAAYDGIVKRVQDFGVFVKLDDFNNVTGLCHKSELADIPLHNLSKVFSEGDRVRVKVLKVNLESGKLNLGMKASYFNEGDVEERDEEDEEDEDMEEYIEDSDEEMDLNDSDSDDLDEVDESEENESDKEQQDESNGLSAGFDWTASILDQMKEDADSDSDSDEEEDGKTRKRRRRGPQVVEDKTASLSTKLPQSVSDFERLLMGSPNSSVMWMNYMAFQLQLSEIEKAREIGQRALKSIGLRYEDEKLNIWVALLNLENSFGTPETLEDQFKQSCQYMDAQTMHVKMATIYSSSDKIDKAVEMYNTACKKFGRQDVSLWVSYGQMLYNHDRADEAREVLDKALRMVQNTVTVHQSQRELISKYAVLEYNKGDKERGRTLFEGLVSSYPRRIDIWNVYVDQEKKINDHGYLTRLFERVIANVKLSQKQAKFFFKKWLTHEAKNGDEKSQDYVKAKAAEYVQKANK